MLYQKRAILRRLGENYYFYLIKEGYEPVTNCNQLKLTAQDGKQRLTDVANAEGLFRIIQSIPSKKAKPFKQWVAQDCGSNACSD